MGVTGLWDLLRPAAVRTSLSELGRDGFVNNKNNNRAFTIGVDASIWIFHAQQSHAGSNAFQRTLFYKINHLLQHPIRVVFVFDGPNKPSTKRGQRVAGQFGVNDIHSRKFKELLDACGIEWWNAPGEAEAELALMNRQGKIDAVLSDDVDALLFGAVCLLRNNSPTLSGAVASSTQTNSSKAELRHYEMFRIRDICAEWSKDGSQLHSLEDCRMGMVLIAILSGGDYDPEGFGRIGPTKAFALARAGHAKFLKEYVLRRSAFDRSLLAVQQAIVMELSTNASGFLGRRYRENASRLAELETNVLFAELPLESYLCPSTSPPDDPSKGWPGFGVGQPTSGRGKARNCGALDLEGMALACELLFEFGTRDIVCKKFSSDSINLFGAEIIAEARNKVLVPLTLKQSSAVSAASVVSQTSRVVGQSGLLTSHFSQSAVYTTTNRQVELPIPKHFVKLYSTRPCPTCPGMKEYRLGYNPAPYINRVRRAMKGTCPDPSTLSAEERAQHGLVGSEKVTDTTIKDELRVWIPEYIIQHAWPTLLSNYEDELAEKERVKNAPKKKKAAPKAPKKKTADTGSADIRNFFRPSKAGPSVIPDAESASASASTSASASASSSEHEAQLSSDTDSDYIPPSSPSKRRAGTQATPFSTTILPTPSTGQESRRETPRAPSTPYYDAFDSPTKLTSTLPPYDAAAHSDISIAPALRRRGSSSCPIDLTLSSDEETPKPKVSSRSRPGNGRSSSPTPIKAGSRLLSKAMRSPSTTPMDSRSVASDTKPGRQTSSQRRRPVPEYTVEYIGELEFIDVT